MEGGGRVEESSSREEGGLCLKGPSHKNIIGRDLVSTVRTGKLTLVWTGMVPTIRYL